MKQFKPKIIVAGFDFSDCSTTAVEFAGRFAQAWSARLIVIHAAPVPSLSGAPYVSSAKVESSFAHDRADLEGQVSMRMQDVFPSERLPGIRVAHGEPSETILTAAEEEHADVIVVGTEGRGGLKRLALGSVAEQLLRLARIPVLTMRCNPESSGRSLSVRQVLCPVNYSSVAGAAFEHAVAVAKHFAAELTVMHLVEDPAEAEDLSRERERLRVWVGEAGPPETHLRLRVQTGDAADQVLQYAVNHHIDLIVLGAQHKKFRDTTVLGSTTERVTRQAICPVLTVPVAV